MDEKVRKLLDQIPEKPPRSKLEPHLEVIRVLRRKGRTYQEIAQFLGEHLNVPVAASTIHAFVQVRSRRRQGGQQIELPPAATSRTETETAPPANIGTTASTEAGIMDRIEALKRRQAQEKPAKQRFEHDETQALQILPAGKREGCP